jgi:hypothetical protein
MMSTILPRGIVLCGILSKGPDFSSPTCFQILLPAAFVCLAMVFTLVVPPLENEQPLELHPWNYPTWCQCHETFSLRH